MANPTLFGTWTQHLPNEIQTKILDHTVPYRFFCLRDFECACGEPCNGCYEEKTCWECWETMCSHCSADRQCSQCERLFCTDCDSVELCQRCERPFCLHCQRVEYCQRCDETICDACGFDFCETCMETVCNDCGDVTWDLNLSEGPYSRCSMCS